MEEILFLEGDTINLKNSDVKGFLFKILDWILINSYDDETPYKTIIIENCKEERGFYIVKKKDLSLYTCRMVLIEKNKL